MRRNPTVAAGWTTLTPAPLDALAICADVCRTSIAWRAGSTELQVFGLFPSGAALPIGVQPAFTYR